MEVNLLCCLQPFVCSMSLDVHNYSKKKKKIIFFGDAIKNKEGPNGLLLPNQWTQSGRKRTGKLVELIEAGIMVKAVRPKNLENGWRRIIKGPDVLVILLSKSTFG